MAQVLPYRHSSCTQFSAPSQTECHRMMRHCVSSSTGTKLGQLQKTLFKLKALSFRFAPKGTADAPCKLNSTENARFETRSLLSAQATSCNRSRINAGGLQTVRKTAGHKFQPLIAKGNRVRWLSHEFFHDRHGNQYAAHGFAHLQAKTAIAHIRLSPHDARHCSPLDLVASLWIALP